MLARLRQLYSHLTPRRRLQLAGLVALMLLGAVAEMATLGAVMPVLALLADPASADRAIQGYPVLRDSGLDRSALLQWTVAVFAVVAVSAAAIRMVLFRVSYRFTFGVGGDLGREVYLRTLQRPYSWHAANNSSEILAAIEKVSSVTNSVIVQLVQGGVAAAVGLAILVSLLVIDAGTALTAGTVFVVLYLLTTVLGRRFLRRNAGAVAVNRTNRVKAVQEGLGGIRDVLLDATQPVYVARFAGYDGAMRRAQASNAFIGASPRVVMEAAGVLLILGIAFMLSGREGGLAGAVPVLGALALGAQKLLPQMQQVYVAWSAISGSRGELDDVLRLLDAPPPIPQEPAPSPPADAAACPLIAVRGVRFRYGPDAPEVLRGVELEIPKGARIGFVGATGGGKSTLIDLILGLLEPTEGTIEVDGAALRPQTMRAWQDRIAHVPQAIHLIDASIAENVALGTPIERIDWPRLEASAATAQLAGFVAGFPDGYRTVVGERGVRLSGGQRQRIGLARALYKQADVLVLDEATSALDNRTEGEVMAALNALHRDKTVLMIAHRLSTIRDCDQIVVIKDGAIVGLGDWAALTATNRHFQAIAAGAAAREVAETADAV